MNEITIMENPRFGKVRKVMVNGEWYYVALDIAKALGYAKERNAIAAHCRCALKRGVPHPQNPNKEIEMTVIPKGDVLRLISESHLPAAEEFNHWLFDDVAVAVIPLHEENDRFPVNGRELHEQLKINTPYHIWFPRMCEYGFEASKDFQTMNKNVQRADGTIMPKQQIDHNLTINMAKEICMIQRTEQGRAIRRHLIAVEDAWNSPDAVINRALKISQSRVEALMADVVKLEDDNSQLTAKIESDKPKVQFAESFECADTNILIREFAKILCQHGYETGEQRLYATLRKEGYLVSLGADYNLPTQRSTAAGWFYVRVTPHPNYPNNVLRRTTMVTPKGQIYFLKHFCGKNYRLSKGEDLIQTTIEKNLLPFEEDLSCNDEDLF